MITKATIDTSYGDPTKGAPYISIDLMNMPGVGLDAVTDEQRLALIDAMAKAALPFIPSALGFVGTTIVDETETQATLRPTA